GEQDHPAVFPVKPIERLRDLRVYLTGLFATRPAMSAAATSTGKAGRDPVRVVVAGGGATGCEIAANVAALAESCGGRAAITIVTGSSRLLRQLPVRAAADVERFLRRRG